MLIITHHRKYHLKRKRCQNRILDSFNMKSSARAGSVTSLTNDCFLYYNLTNESRLCGIVVPFFLSYQVTSESRVFCSNSVFIYYNLTTARGFVTSYVLFKYYQPPAGVYTTWDIPHRTYIFSTVLGFGCINM